MNLEREAILDEWKASCRTLVKAREERITITQSTGHKSMKYNLRIMKG